MLPSPRMHRESSGMLQLYSSQQPHRYRVTPLLLGLLVQHLLVLYTRWSMHVVFQLLLLVILVLAMVSTALGSLLLHSTRYRV